MTQTLAGFNATAIPYGSRGVVDTFGRVTSDQTIYVNDGTLAQNTVVEFQRASVKVEEGTPVRNGSIVLDKLERIRHILYKRENAVVSPKLLTRARKSRKARKSKARKATRKH